MSNPYKIDWNEYAALARQAVAEGCVLLKNDDKALPIRKGERVSVFGRIQFDYYKSGTGSGGAVNTRYVTNILDALKENKDISVNEELEQTYRDWLKDHPFEKGMGWAQEPWCQEEMPVTKSSPSRLLQSPISPLSSSAAPQVKIRTTVPQKAAIS